MSEKLSRLRNNHMTFIPVPRETNPPILGPHGPDTPSVIGTTDPHKTSDIGPSGHSNYSDLGMQQRFRARARAHSGVARIFFY